VSAIGQWKFSRQEIMRSAWECGTKQVHIFTALAQSFDQIAGDGIEFFTGSFTLNQRG
jgi:hypothetical protein